MDGAGADRELLGEFRIGRTRIFHQRAEDTAVEFVH